jgi:hypothetical protein
MPAAFAMLRTLHWVAFGGFSCEIMCTCLIFSGVNGLTREGRVASFNSPAALRHIAARPAADREQALAHRRNPLLPRRSRHGEGEREQSVTSERRRLL